MRNFLQETQDEIASSGHTEQDIIFIGSEQSGHQCSWAEFLNLSDFDYDSGFGSAEIPPDLCIVFADGHKLTRGEYDGSEWWEHTWPFRKPSISLPIKKLYRENYESSLSEIAENKVTA